MSADSSSTNSGTPQTWGAVAGTLWAGLAFLGPRLIIAPLVPLIASLPFGSNAQNFMLEAVIDLLVLGALMAILQLYHVSFTTLGLAKKLPAVYFGLALTMLPLYFVASFTTTWLLATIFPSIDANAQQELGFSIQTGGPELLLVFVALVVVPPFVEELVFRGFLYNAYRRFGAVVASIVVSLCFALLHAPLIVGIDVFVLSLFLCYLRETTNSLWPSILLHGMKNFVAFIYLFIMKGQ